MQKVLDLSASPRYNHDTPEDENAPRKVLPFGECLDLTTFLTIDRIRTCGISGVESSGKAEFPE